MVRPPFLLLLLCTACSEPRAWQIGGATLSVAPASVDFGAVALGTSAFAVVEVTNTGSETATGTTAASSPFSATGGFDLAPGASASVNVLFAPTDYQPAAGVLSLTLEDGTVTEVALAGSTDPDADRDGYTAVGAGGDDCDDADPTVYPGAAETWYDGVDQDCAGDDDDDQDGDGAPVDTDCDDTDASRSPLGSENDGNAVDDDCDGLVDEGAHTPGALYLSELRTGEDAAFELCNATAGTIHLDHLELGTEAGTQELDPSVARDPSPLEPGGCAAFAASDSGYFTWELDLVLAAGGDTLTVRSGDTLVDSVQIAPSWGWATGSTYALGAPGSAVANDAAANWCGVDSPTWGSPNPADPCL